jgi:CRISPR-associated endonuclease/helicase Cas3
MNETAFNDAFVAVAGNSPFPWQWDLYQRFISDRSDNIPSSCNLPTGLGKTSVIHIWLLALATASLKVPRRLVYVVNRRTVVDQSTDETMKIRDRLIGAFGPPTKIQLEIAQTLARLSADPTGSPLAISTLRGQFADNREWSADPSRPAIICGTVDMIGSRLLFSGYGCGFKTRPLHAGFLGQDALLIHDEAHLEPAFQDLVMAIESEQKRCKEFRRFRVMELTATSRSKGDVFELTSDEKEIPAELPAKPCEPKHYVWQRMKSKKGLRFHPAKRDAVATRIGELARDQWKNSGKAILIFVRTIDDVKEVKAVLTDKKKGGVAEDQVRQLTGTLRGKERDALATTDTVFARFSPEPKVKVEEGTVYLICTSAGEVGVDISADHMICDLSTLDSMAQRFGRVNRRGEGTALIDVVYETDQNPKPPSPTFEAARWETKKVLERLSSCDWTEGQRYDASPSALGVVMKSLTEEERKAAFAPKPTVLPVTDMLFDAWALTTIRDKLPGRPHVEPYLHGLTDWQPPETHVAWREEVERLQPEPDDEKSEVENRRTLAQLAEKLLEDYPLKPHELLREPSYRAYKQFEAMKKRCPNLPVWLLDEDGKVLVLTVAELSDKEAKKQIESMTVLLPPSAGGLDDGILNGSVAAPEEGLLDVADEWYADKEKTIHLRIRLDDNNPPKGMRLIRRVSLPGGSEENDPEFWYWFERYNEGDLSANQPVEWHVHVKDVEDHLAKIVDKFPLDGLQRVLKLAAKFHDHGKRRKLFQFLLANPNYPRIVLAKSGKKGGRVEERYRHEFGSLLDLQKEPEFQTLTDDEKDLVLHLIATHHGRGRPHFPSEEAFDPDHPSSTTDSIACEVPRRFARLQRKYGRWRLAYLESLLRAADWAASAEPSSYYHPEGEK